MCMQPFQSNINENNETSRQRCKGATYMSLPAQVLVRIQIRPTGPRLLLSLFFLHFHSHASRLGPLWPQQRNNSLKRIAGAHDKDKASKWKLSGARSTIALADDAEVVAGPGSVPLGRWHSPDGHARSGRCGRSGEAREEREAINLSLR